MRHSKAGFSSSSNTAHSRFIKRFLSRVNKTTNKTVGTGGGQGREFDAVKRSFLAEFICIKMGPILASTTCRYLDYF